MTHVHPVTLAVECNDAGRRGDTCPGCRGPAANSKRIRRLVGGRCLLAVPTTVVTCFYRCRACRYVFRIQTEFAADLAGGEDD